MNDAGFATEKWLLDNIPNEISSDVIVKGRHASDYSGLPEFLTTVEPLVVVSTNASFPPDEKIPDEWMKILSDKNITLFDQSKTGAVDIQCHPDKLQIQSFLNSQSFTQQAP